MRAEKNGEGVKSETITRKGEREERDRKRTERKGKKSEERERVPGRMLKKASSS